MLRINEIALMTADQIVRITLFDGRQAVQGRVVAVDGMHGSMAAIGLDIDDMGQIQ